MNSVPALVIAAGSSSRLGQPKQLLVLDGETLLQRAIRIACESGASPVLVVLGAHLEQIEPGIDRSQATVVVNSGWEEGMASSIRLGIQALEAESPQAAGVLFMICDQPAVSAEHLRLLLASFRQDPATPVASVYAGKRGIPAIFPRPAFPSLLALRGDQGARRLLADPNRNVIELALDGGGLDIDRPEDLPRLRSL